MFYVLFSLENDILTSTYVAFVNERTGLNESPPPPPPSHLPLEFILALENSVQVVELGRHFFFLTAF